MQRAYFGDCLGQLMRLKGVSPKDLARALHLADATLVYRWLRNERVPKLDSEYLDPLSATLRLDDTQRAELRMAQTVSLEQHPSRRYTVARAHNQQVDDSLTRLFERSRTVPTSREHLVRRPVAPPRQGVPPQASALVGHERIVDRLAELIEQAPAPSPTVGDELLLTAQGRALLDTEPRAQRRLISALHQAIERGWSVSHLWRLDEHTDRTIHLLDMMLDLVGSHCYFPYYVRPYGLLSPPYEVAVVPGVCAMLMFGASTTDTVDTAFVVTEPELVGQLHAHFIGLRDQALPLFTGVVFESQEISITTALVHAEAQPGGRLIVKNGISGLTHPPSWFVAGSLLARRAVETGLVRHEHLGQYLALLRRRLHEFERLVHTYDYLDICPKRTISQLVLGGTYHPDAPFYGQAPPVPLRLEHLRHIILMLKSYPRYRLALLDEVEEIDVPAVPSRIVAGDGNAFMSTWTLDAAGSPVLANVHITEPTIVDAFRTHFAAEWRRIAPRNRDKQYVIQWLERRVSDLERDVAEQA